MQKDRCFICSTPIKNSDSYFLRFGNSCFLCDQFSSSLSRCSENDLSDYLAIQSRWDIYCKLALNKYSLVLS